MKFSRQDAVAGVTTAAVVIPQAMAYATIAGLPVEVGLYTALVPMLAYALVGSSRALSVSTTSTLAALTGAAVGTVAGGDADRAIEAATTLAMLTGVLLLAASVFKLGFVADFISQPVLAGFKAGTGLLIAAGQLGKVLGIDQTGDNFFQKMGSALSQLDDIDWATAALAAVTIALLLGLKRWAPAVPGALVAVGVGVAVGAWGLLDVALTGDVPSGLPHPVAPDLDLIGPLFPAAMGVALMSFVESVAAGRAVTHTGEEEPDADRELRALGAANLLGGIFRALPSGGGLSQTAVNDNAGASSRMAGAVTGIVSLLTLLFLTGLFADLPQATLGAHRARLGARAVLAGAAERDPRDPSARLHARARDAGLRARARRAGGRARRRGHVDADARARARPPGHPRGRRTPATGSSSASSAACTSPTPSASAASCWRWSSEHHPRELVVDLSAVPGIDVTTLTLLPVFDRQLAARGVTLQLAALNPEPLADFRRSPAADALAGTRAPRRARGRPASPDSGDLDVADGHGARARGDERRQQGERRGGPAAVTRHHSAWSPARQLQGAAAPPERAREALPGGEGRRALGGLVTMLEQEVGHDWHSGAPGLSAYIRGAPGSPRSTVRATSTREDAPSLAKMLRRCDSTVFSLRKSVAAISRLVWRAVTRPATSRSRVESEASPLSAGRGRPARLGARLELAQLAPGEVAVVLDAVGGERLLRGAQRRDRLRALARGRQRTSRRAPASGPS